MLYPKRAEYELAKRGQEWLPERREIEQIATENGLIVVDVSQAPEWDSALNRSDNVHPSVESNVVPANLLASATKQVLASEPISIDKDAHLLDHEVTAGRQ